jgi:hypothetical protein
MIKFMACLENPPSFPKCLFILRSLHNLNDFLLSPGIDVKPKIV